MNTSRDGNHQPRGQWITKHKRLAIYIRDGFGCVYCGRSLRDATPSDVTLDHLLARSAGGDNDARNLVTACKSCNSSRQDRPWADFAPGGARDRILTLIARPLNIPLAKAIIDGSAGDAQTEAAR